MSGGISYQTHLQNVGWTPWVANDKMSGTTGESRAMEAIKIKLTGAIASSYDVYYSVHVSDFGWLGLAKNGENAGTTGGSKQMEAIQIRLMHKGDNSIKTGGAYIDLSASNTAVSFAMPLANAKCSWRNSSNWSWAGKNNSKYHLGIDITGSSDNVMATANGTVKKMWKKWCGKDWEWKLCCVGT